jgi:hypothetical protein
VTCKSQITRYEYTKVSIVTAQLNENERRVSSKRFPACDLSHNNPVLMLKAFLTLEKENIIYLLQKEKKVTVYFNNELS